MSLDFLELLVFVLSLGGAVAATVSWLYVGRWLAKANGTRPFLRITRDIAIGVVLVGWLMFVTPLIDNQDWHGERALAAARITLRLALIWIVFSLIRLGYQLRGYVVAHQETSS